MTDYTKLIERMRTDSAFDFTTLGNEAADAIEALQEEVSTLDVLLEECKMDKEGNYHPYVNAIGRDVPFEWVERFYALVRNAALEDAAKVCFAMPAPISCNRVEANLCDVMTAQCANEIRNLKEPTP